jgi:hypothetical protein
LDTELRNRRQIFTTGNDHISYLTSRCQPPNIFPNLKVSHLKRDNLPRPVPACGQAADETHFNSGRVIMAAAASLISGTTNLTHE